MSLRKGAGLLVALGLMAGLIQSGVAAQFTDQVTATENINVGSFSCVIDSSTAGTLGNYVNGFAHSVTYTAPTILSSASSTAPFQFNVKNNGDMAMDLHVTAAVTQRAGGPFSSMPVYDQVINPGEINQFVEGLSWGNLTNADLGTSASVTYTVACSDVTQFTTFGPASVSGTGTGPYTIVSTGTTDLPPYGNQPNWGGIAVPAHSGDLLANVKLSFDQTGGTATVPRWSIPISQNGSTFTGVYAFISESDCTPTSPVGTNANCGVYYGVNHYTNWAAFAAAQPTWKLAPGSVPWIVVDGTNGTFTISNITTN